jgi:16S rRNA (cytidine1402-2'-O)-methyltransferase
MWQKTDLEPALYFVATPIGSARDITLRALDVLASADVLAAEDTRTLRRLMTIHGVDLAGRKVVAYHDHNGPAVRPRLIAMLGRGLSVAYAAEAGTPLIADPGFALAREAIEAGFAVRSVPGASAVLAALGVAGLPTDRFLFAGFPPPSGAARRSFLHDLAAVPATLVLYESPRRVRETLTELAQSFGDGRRAVICRELTKRFEEVRRGTLAELRDGLPEGDLKGEVVLVVDRAEAGATSAADIETALRQAMGRMSLKDAVEAVARAGDLPRREVYKAALALDAEKEWRKE